LLSVPVKSLAMANDSGSMAAASASAPLEPTDARLIADACAGDAASFETLVRRHYRTAFAVALAHAGNRPDAEDVCHDAFVRAAEHLERCRRPERFAAWLCAIVRNRAHNLRAHGIVRRAEVLDEQTAVSDADPERDTQLSELRDRLLAALDTLLPVQREVVLLHDVDGMMHDEIAAVIGTSSGMSRQHLFKARKRLRQALGGTSTMEFFHD
jgi:RNA polymerase sigma-70 factor (ECF subfamily)